MPAAGEVWHYRLLVVKQADLVDTSVAVEVTAPSGWRVAGSTAWRRVTATPVTTKVDGTVVRVTTSLKQDLLVDVTLVKA
jgi:hypothetical protein